MVIDNPQDLQSLIDLDSPDGCGECIPAARAVANDVLTALGRWWLSDARRGYWGVGTQIEGRPKSVTFQLLLPRRPLPVPTVLVMRQHWKHLPHYQLQAPHGNLGDGFSDQKATARVAELRAECDARMTPFRAPKLKSIALHEVRPLSDWLDILDAISRLSFGIAKLSSDGR